MTRATRSCRPLRRRPQERPHGPIEPGQRFGQARRVGPARMHRVHDDPRSSSAGPTRARAPPASVWPARTPRPENASWPTEVDRSTACVYMPPDVTLTPGRRRPRAAAAGARRSARRARRRARPASPRCHPASPACRIDRPGVVDQDVEARFRGEDLRHRPAHRREGRHVATTIGNRSSPWRRTRSSRTAASRSRSGRSGAPARQGRPPPRWPPAQPRRRPRDRHRPTARASRARRLASRKAAPRR